MIYKIPAVNFPRLDENIQKLNKRASRLGVDLIELEIVETERVVKKSRMGFEYDETFYHCEVKGEAPQLKGWSLVACIEPVEDGSENMVREVPGMVCPANYRTTDMHCDHCKTDRKRNAVFVLKHTDGRVRQVGRSCIADFLGHADPEKLLNDAQYIFNFMRMVGESQEEYVETSDRLPTTAEFVSVVSVISRQMGWVPKSKADETKQATADLAWNLCIHDNKFVRDFIKENEIEVMPKDIERANKALAWARDIDPEKAPNTYLHDLGVSCRQDCVSWKRRGYVASVVSSYQRNLEKVERSKIRAISKFVGTLKERKVFEKLKIVGLHEYTTDYGVRTIVKLVDTSGNILIWRASGSPEWLESGDTFDVKATVVKHEATAGIEETFINRVVQWEAK